MTAHIDIVECPHCHTRVLPKADNICPACRRNILDMQDVDPNMVSLIVRESQDLPPYCYLCNSVTERYVEIIGDKGTFLDQSLMFLMPTRKFEENTSNVFVELPQCETCAEKEEPSPLYVDYENQSMTFVVNIGFKERVQATIVDQEHPDGDAISDEESSRE